MQRTRHGDGSDWPTSFQALTGTGRHSNRPAQQQAGTSDGHPGLFYAGGEFDLSRANLPVMVRHPPGQHPAQRDFRHR